MASHFLSQKKNSAVVFIFLALFCLTAFFPAAARAQQGFTDESLENYTEGGRENLDDREAVENAQATLASLFGKGTTMAVPPQIAGGTVALPSFDSRGLEMRKESAEED